MIEDYVERLEEDAAEITTKIERLYHDAEKTRKVSSSSPFTPSSRGSSKLIWSEPEGKTKALQNDLRGEYESWYARAEELVSSHFPQRLDEFQSTRREVKEYIKMNKNAKLDPERYVNRATDFFAEQRNVVKAIPGKVEAERLNLRRQISDTFSKEELQQARELLDEELFRASGVLSGIALENHLQLECDEVELDYKHDDGIARLAQILYEGGEISSTTLSNIETLGQIRNDCAHANQQEPNKHKVGKLIEDTEDYIRGRGI